MIKKEVNSSDVKKKKYPVGKIVLVILLLIYVLQSGVAMFSQITQAPITQQTTINGGIGKNEQTK